MRERPGQGIEGESDEIVVAVIGKGQGVVAGEQPAQHTVWLARVARPSSYTQQPPNASIMK